jgi:CcmD family protein
VSTGAQYVVAAYAVIWFALLLYVLTIASRTARLGREVELLARLAEDADALAEGDDATSTITALHDRAEAIRQEAIARQEGRWEGLSAADRARVEHLTRAIMGQLLHEPTVRLRDGVEGRDGVVHLESLRHLFALEAPTTREAARPVP